MIDKLLKMMKNFEHGFDVNSYWPILTKVVNCIKSNTATVVDIKWDENYAEYKRGSLEKMDTWSTYEELIKFCFMVDNNVLMCQARIYDKSYYYDCPKLRFSAVIKMPNDFVLEIKDYIEGEFKYLLLERYDEYLEQQKQEWMNNLSKQLLGE